MGRDGSYWIENIPLSGGTNSLTLAAADAVGNTSTTNILVVQGAVSLTVDSASFADGSASGSVSDPTCAVWVNGVQAVNNGDGTWDASSLIFTRDTVVVQARSIPNSDNSGNGSGGASSSGGGNSAANASQGNPYSASATEGETELAWPVPWRLNVRSSHLADYEFDYVIFAPGEQTTDYIEDWQDGVGGSGFIRTWDYAGNPTIKAKYVWEPPSAWPDYSGVAYSIDEIGNTTNYLTSDASYETGKYGWVDGDYGGYWDQDPSAQPYGYDSNVNWHDHHDLFIATDGLPGSSDLYVYTIRIQANALLPQPAAGAPLLTNVSLCGQSPVDSQADFVLVLPAHTILDATPVICGAAYYSQTPGVTKNGFSWTTVALTPANRSRTDLGVGEQVKLAFNPQPPEKPLWSLDGAGSLVPDSFLPSSATFTAPSNTATATITPKFSSGALNPVVFNVVEPKGVASATIVATNTSFGINVAGAGMQLNVAIGPTNVSFYRVQVFEVGQNASGISGYFVNNPPGNHDSSTGANVWHPIGYNNLVDVANQFDTCWYGGASVLPSPWSPGAASLGQFLRAGGYPAAPRTFFRGRIKSSHWAPMARSPFKNSAAA